MRQRLLLVVLALQQFSERREIGIPDDPDHIPDVLPAVRLGDEIRLRLAQEQRLDRGLLGVRAHRRRELKECAAIPRQIGFLAGQRGVRGALGVCGLRLELDEVDHDDGGVFGD